MKKLILILSAIILITFILSSCTASRRSGCPDTWDKVGYN